MRMEAEISYDLVMEENMSFVEGTYRLPQSEWQVFIFCRRAEMRMEVKRGSWASGVTGVVVYYPPSECLNKTVVERVLGSALGVTKWIEVRGPDSMTLR